MTLKDITSEQAFLSETSKGFHVVHFWAAWCSPCKDLDKVLLQLQPKYPQIQFSRVDAEALADLTEKFGVSVVPYFLFIKDGNTFAKVEGANVQQLVQQVQKAGEGATLPASTPSNQGETQQTLEEKLRKLTTKAPTMLFMKGNPDQPRCGFSRQIVQILRNNNISFDYFDILTDETVRQGLKTYSKWPTYPQLYSGGNLIGGLDIVKELEADGTLLDEIGN